MKRSIPLAICLIMGITMMVQFFVPHPASVALLRPDATTWIRIVGAFALVLGVGSLVMYHLDKIQRRRTGWYYSIVTLVAAARHRRSSASAGGSSPAHRFRTSSSATCWCR